MHTIVESSSSELNTTKLIVPQLVSVNQQCKLYFHERPEEEKCNHFPLLKHLEFGQEGSLYHRILFRKNGWQYISPWHNIPLFGPKKLLSFVCGTPKGQWIQHEFSGNEEFNPIRVKQERGRPSHYAQNVPFHYGFLPQTLCTGERRSSAALHAFDLSTFQNRKCGDSYFVRPLAAIPVMDEGSPLSWHLITIDSEHPMANLVNSTQDLLTLFPGVISSIVSWLKIRNCSYAEVVESVVFEKVIELNQEEIINFVLEEAHEKWKQKFGVSHLFLRAQSLTRPLSSAQCEWVWKKYTDGKSKEVIQLSETIYESSFKYNKAWEQLMALEEAKIPEEEEIKYPQIDEVKKIKRWASWKSKKPLNLWDLQVSLEQIPRNHDRKTRGLRRSISESFVPLSFRKRNSF